MSVARRLVILGSTGSIGVQALDVVSRSGGELEVVGLSAGSDWEALLEQARGARRAADRARRPRRGGTRRREPGPARRWPDPSGLVELITEAGCDLVLNAIVGSAGLVPTVATLGEGIDLALANKESLVVGGELVTQLAEATGAQIIPVDSEHSALHQLLASERRGNRRAAGPDRLGRAVPGPDRGRAAGRDGRAGARSPDVGDGRQDHDRLGDADEQGA